MTSFNRLNGDPDAIDDISDDSIEYNLNLLNGLHDLLRQPEAPESFYQYLLRGAKGVGKVEEFYKGLRDFNEFYGLELNIEELDPEYEAYVKAHPVGEPEKKEEIKEEEPVKKAQKAAKAEKKE